MGYWEAAEAWDAWIDGQVDGYYVVDRPEITDEMREFALSIQKIAMDNKYRRGWMYHQIAKKFDYIVAGWLVPYRSGSPKDGYKYYYSLSMEGEQNVSDS